MIYIDASRYNSTNQHTGVENYSYFLIDELIKQHPQEISLIVQHQIDLPVAQIIIPLKRLWTQLGLSWQVLKNQKIDHLFIPSHVLPLIHPRHTIVTIHDVAFRRFPKSYSKVSHWYLNWSTRFAVKKAYRIITPSTATAKDLVKFFKADRKKIVVIPHGHAVQKSMISDTIQKNILQKFGIKKKNYFLYIGRIESKKNLLMLIEAFKEILPFTGGTKLVLAGKDGYGYEEIRQAAKKEKNIIFTGYIDEAQKSILLKNALAFVYPSLYEGFGLPLLEAMAYGLPIIASDIPASREVAKNAALFFPPHDHQKLTQQLKKIINNKSKHHRLAAEQKAILERHRWSLCAAKTWETLTRD